MAIEEVPRLLAALNALYGKDWAHHRTTESEMEVIIAEWFSALTHFTKKLIVEVLNELKNRKDIKTMNLLNFVGMCKTRQKIINDAKQKTSPDGHYEPLSEKTHAAFIENIEKCSKEGRTDLSDALCRFYALAAEKGAWVEN